MVVVSDQVVRCVISILDDCHSRLIYDRSFNCRTLETEIMECLDISSDDVNKLVVDLSRSRPYVYVATYYMEHSNPQGIADEFKRPLMDAYGIASSRSSDRHAMRMSFWNFFFSRCEELI